MSIAIENFVKAILNYRKNSDAIKQGKTLHFAPYKGTYFLFRIYNDEVVVHIINKNKSSISLDLNRFKEVGLEGKKFKNLITGESFIWNDVIELSEKGSTILTTKL